MAYIPCPTCERAPRARDYAAHVAQCRLIPGGMPIGAKVTHSGDPDFLAALDEMRALHLSKGHDYADATDPLRNYVESSRDCGVQPWRGAMLRLSEKYHRLTNLIAKDATPNFESLEDTLMDMAALALIVRSLRRRQAPRGVTEVMSGVWVVDAKADATGEP
jgi:hypothetical protein